MATTNAVIVPSIAETGAQKNTPGPPSEEQYWIQVNKFLQENRKSYKQGLMVVAAVRVGVLVALFSSIRYLVRPQWQSIAAAGALILCMLVLELWYIHTQVEQANKNAKEQSS